MSVFFGSPRAKAAACSAAVVFSLGSVINAAPPATMKLPNAMGSYVANAGLSLSPDILQTIRRSFPPPPKPNGGPAPLAPNCYIVSGEKFTASCTNNGQAVPTNAQLVFMAALNSPNLKEMHIFVKGFGSCSANDNGSIFSAPKTIYPTPDQADLTYEVKGPPGMPFYTYMTYFVFQPSSLKKLKNAPCTLFANNKQLEGTVELTSLSGTVTATMKDNSKKIVDFSIKIA